MDNINTYNMDGVRSWVVNPTKDCNSQLIKENSIIASTRTVNCP